MGSSLGCGSVGVGLPGCHHLSAVNHAGMARYAESILSPPDMRLIVHFLACQQDRSCMAIAASAWPSQHVLGCIFICSIGRFWLNCVTCDKLRICIHMVIDQCSCLCKVSGKIIFCIVLNVLWWHECFREQ